MLHLLIVKFVTPTYTCAHTT